MDWPRLIAEHDEWVAHNFPNNTLPQPQESVLGLIEEVGELAHADLKERQSIRGTPEEHQANAKDAIGDATVYLWGVMSHFSMYDTQSVAQHTLKQLDSAQGCIFVAAKGSGAIGSWVTTSRTGLVRVNVNRVVAALEAYCTHRGWDYELIVTETWNKVSKRDWIADPTAGGEYLPCGCPGAGCIGHVERVDL